MEWITTALTALFSYFYMFLIAKLMGHRAMTVCSIIANRFNNDANPNYKGGVRDIVRTVLERL